MREFWIFENLERKRIVTMLIYVKLVWKKDRAIAMDQAGLILKVLIVSTGLAAAIKYIGPTVFIPTTPQVVLAIVLMPTAIVAVALLWRISKTQQLN